MARATQKENSARGAHVSLPENLQWSRVHPITPLLQGWKLIAGLLAFFTYQNLDEALEAYKAIKKSGYSLADIDHTALIAGLGGTAVVFILVAVGLYMSWRARSFALDADAVYYRQGIWDKQVRIARLPRIQSVDIVHPVLGRIFGLGQLVVDVAGGSDSHVTIGYLRTHELDDLRRSIFRLASGEQSASPASAQISDAAAHPGSEPSPASMAGSGQPTPATRAGEEGLPGQASASEIPQRQVPGFEQATGARLRPDEPEETPLYQVDTRVLTGSILRSFGIYVGLLITLVMVVAVIVQVIHGKGGVLDAIITALPAIAVPVAALGSVWKTFSRGWGFRAAATPAGIRVRYGMTAAVSTTLPPGRVHAVKLSQSPLWRGKDWWKAEATLAGSSAGEKTGDDAHETGMLLPVGDRDTALRALWLVTPDLGTPDPDAVLEAALSGLDDAGVGEPSAPLGTPERGFVRVSPRSRLFTPIGIRRTAVLATETCLMIRTGRWWRQVLVIPYARIQSFKVLQGPWARRRGLAGFDIDLVKIVSGTTLNNFEAQDMAAFERIVAERSLQRSRTEKLDRWLARATA